MVEDRFGVAGLDDLSGIGDGDAVAPGGNLMRLTGNARALLTAERRDGAWRLETKAGPVRAGVLVNAAGAWADTVAGMAGAAPIGIIPYRRTMMQLRTDPPAPAEEPDDRQLGLF